MKKKNLKFFFFFFLKTYFYKINQKEHSLFIFHNGMLFNKGDLFLHLPQ